MAPVLITSNGFLAPKAAAQPGYDGPKRPLRAASPSASKVGKADE